LSRRAAYLTRRVDELPTSPTRAPRGRWRSIGAKGGRGGDAETTEGAMALRPAGLLGFGPAAYDTTNASPDSQRLVIGEMTQDAF